MKRVTKDAPKAKRAASGIRSEGPGVSSPVRKGGELRIPDSGEARKPRQVAHLRRSST